MSIKKFYMKRTSTLQKIKITGEICMGNFEKIIEEICDERRLSLSKYLNGELLRLESLDNQVTILNYEFPLNTAPVSVLCNDRVATSDILMDYDVPVVTQHYLASPGSMSFHDQPWTTTDIKGYIDSWGTIVCKPNTGPCGDNVFYVNTEKELFKCVYSIFNDNSGAAISKYMPADMEYRVVMLNGNPLLVYKKVLPSVFADGIRTVSALVGRLYKHPVIERDFIPNKGDSVPVDWRHNARHGVKVYRLDSSEVDPIIIDVAINTCKALGCSLACVDVLSTDSGYKVIEVKTSVKLERFSAVNEDYYAIAKSVYSKLVDYSFLAIDKN